MKTIFEDTKECLKNFNNRKFVNVKQCIGEDFCNYVLTKNKDSKNNIYELLNDKSIRETEVIEKELTKHVLDCCLEHSADAQLISDVLNDYHSVFNDVFYDKIFSTAVKVEQNYEMLLNKISDLVYTHDINGKILYLNNASKEKVGEFDNIFDIVSPEYHEKLKSDFKNALSNKRGIVTNKINIITNEGNLLTVIYKSISEWKDGKIISFTGIATDVTDSEKLESKLMSNLDMLKKEVRDKVKELEERNRRLEAVSVIEDTAVSQIAHELKTPLVPIKGYIELLLKDSFGELNSKQKSILMIIKSASDRLIKLINNILSVSNIRNGYGNKLFPEEIKIKNMIENNLNFLSEQITNKKIRVIMDLDDLIVFADKNKIEEVIYNLLDNAIKYNKVEGKIYITVKSQGNFVKIEIEDTGEGVEEGYFVSIFNKFFKIKEEIGAVTGLGLGLFIVRSILDLHKSNFIVESEKGKGFKFTFFLTKINY